MLNSELDLSNFKLINAPASEVASNFVMDARLELFVVSTMVNPASGLIELAEELLGSGETEVEKELETRVICGRSKEELKFDAAGERSLSLATLDGAPPSLVAGAMVSSKELSLVRFIIQPSSLRNSLSSAAFCQETLSVVDEIASTITSSGWPGNVSMPSATPVWVEKISQSHGSYSTVVVREICNFTCIRVLGQPMQHSRVAFLDIVPSAVDIMKCCIQ